MSSDEFSVVTAVVIVEVTIVVVGGGGVVVSVAVVAKGVVRVALVGAGPLLSVKFIVVNVRNVDSDESVSVGVGVCVGGGVDSVIVAMVGDGVDGVCVGGGQVGELGMIVRDDHRGLEFLL